MAKSLRHKAATPAHTIHPLRGWRWLGAAAFVLLLYYFTPLLSPNATIQWDAVDVHYASQKYFADQVKGAHLPHWTPYIFAEQTAPDGQPLPNRYRRIFLGLANDQLDEDGEPLEPGAKNHLELYGIPPSLSVLRAICPRLSTASITTPNVPTPLGPTGWWSSTRTGASPTRAGPVRLDSIPVTWPGH